VTVLLGLESSGALRAAGEGEYACSGSQRMTAALFSKVENGGMMAWKYLLAYSVGSGLDL
jgi:hypothetical protein